MPTKPQAKKNEGHTFRENPEHIQHMKWLEVNTDTNFMKLWTKSSCHMKFWQGRRLFLLKFFIVSYLFYATQNYARSSSYNISPRARPNGLTKHHGSFVPILTQILERDMLNISRVFRADHFTNDPTLEFLWHWLLIQ